MGLRLRAVIARVGPVPPAAGDARRAFLTHRGVASARLADELFSNSLATVEQLVGKAELPFSDDPFGSPNSVDAPSRLARWQEITGALVVASCKTYTSSRADRLLGPPLPRPLPGEELSRKTLDEAIGAYRDLNAPGMADDQLASAAHWNMHHYAEYVSGLFGCYFKWDPDDGIWYDRCPLLRAHVKFGMSPGFTSKRLCSICRMDITDCDHFEDVEYQVDASRYRDGETDKCTVCHKQHCDHVVGQRVGVFQRPVMDNPVIHESTLTPNPREPRALITDVEMDPQPAPPKLGQRIRCLRCLLPCDHESEELDTPTGV